MRIAHIIVQREWVYNTCSQPQRPHHEMQALERTLPTTEEITGDTGDNNYFSILDSSLKFS